MLRPPPQRLSCHSRWRNHPSPWYNHRSPWCNHRSPWCHQRSPCHKGSRCDYCENLIPFWCIRLLLNDVSWKKMFCFNVFWCHVFVFHVFFLVCFKRGGLCMSKSSWFPEQFALLGLRFESGCWITRWIGSKRSWTKIFGTNIWIRGRMLIPWCWYDCWLASHAYTTLDVNL